jgi:hypothetical protein
MKDTNNTFDKARAATMAQAGKPTRKSGRLSVSESNKKAANVPDKSTMPTAHTATGALMNSPAQMKTGRAKEKKHVPTSSQTGSELHPQPKSGESAVSPAGSFMNRPEELTGPVPGNQQLTARTHGPNTK